MANIRGSLQAISFGRVRQLSLFHPLADRDFKLLFIGQSVSLFGDQFYLVALPWLALQLTGSGFALGTVFMVAGGTRALFQLLGGAISDRLPHRRIMFVSNVVRALVTALMAALILLDITRLWHLYILGFIFGMVDAFFFPAYMAIIPTLVIKEHLAASNALLRGTARFMGLIGPAMAGLVIAGIDLGVAFVFDTATFVFAAVMLRFMNSKDAPSSVEQKQADAKEPDNIKGLFASIGEGLRYAWSDPVLRVLLFFIAVIEFSFMGPSTVGLSTMAKYRFGAGDGAMALGWMLSALGGGTLAGMLLAGSIRVKQRRGRLVTGMFLMAGSAMVLLGFAPNVAVAALALVFVGLSGGLSNIATLAWLQSRSAPGMLGRVMGVMMFAVAVLDPLSYALAGLMADANLTMLFVGSGAIMLVSSAVALATRTMRSAD